MECAELICPYLFRFTSQDGTVAAQLISREPSCDHSYKCKFDQRFPLATTITPSVTSPSDLMADTETSQTTTFHDDKSSISKALPVFVEIDPNLKKSVAENRLHDIKDFLSRPALYTTGVITTQIQNDIITQIQLPSAIYSIPMFAEKLKGFLSLRATVNVRFQANAQRFQQGRLFCSYFPQDTLMTKKFDIVGGVLTLATQLPRVDFDFSTDTDVTLQIPYVSPTLGFNQFTSEGPMGQYFVKVYSPLVSPGGAAAVDWSVYIWLTNVELEYPAYAPQGPGRQIKKAEPDKMEMISSGAGPISNLLAKVSLAAGIFKDVPLLSSVAGTTSWASGILAKTAQSFGFSNPHSCEPGRRTVPGFAHYSNNTDAISNTQNFGILTDTHIANLPGFAGTDLDEMSFRHLTSIPSYISEFTWATSATSGTNLYTTGLKPENFKVQSLTRAEIYWPTPMAYLQPMFEYWRTSFVFTFKFVKTEFHSGRLLVIFNPGQSIGAVSLANSNYLYREVLDLRESNEFTVTVPYVSTNSFQHFAADIGKLQVMVLNPLVAPTTVSSSITCLVEVSAGPDFELAVPVTPTSRPVLYMPGTGAPSLVEEVPPDEFHPQGLGQNAQDQEKTSTSIATPMSIGEALDSGGLSPAMFCVGERIHSFRQLVKRAMPWQYSTASAFSLYGIRPKSIMLDNLSDNVSQRSTFGVDYVSWCAGLFAYVRGGVRFEVFSSLYSVSEASCRLALSTTTDTAVTIGVAVADNGKYGYGMNNVAINNYSVAGGLSVEVPAYSQNHCELVRFPTTANPEPLDAYSNHLRLWIRQGSNLSSAINLRIYRQAGDDWSAGFFTGCLPIELVNFTTDTSMTQW